MMVAAFPSDLVHTTLSSPQGPFHVWATNDELWAAGWDSTEAPHIEASHGHPLHHWAHAIQQALDGWVSVDSLFGLPRARRGTAFQQQVWQALQQLPQGRTCTYHALAQALERPTASRAVAQACAQNPLAVVVPCHRVVGHRGLTGYRWGLARKAWLIEHETSPLRARTHPRARAERLTTSAL